MTLKLDVALKSGTSLAIDYKGRCRLHSDDGGDEGEALALNTPMFSWWLSKTPAGTNNYYIGVSNVPYQISQGVAFAFKEAGYALILDCYTSGEWKTFPTGSFTESAKNDDHTYFDGKSGVVYFDGSKFSDPMHLTGPVEITRDDKNITTISATFINAEGKDQRITFKGDLRVGNGSKLPALPHMMRDIEFTGKEATGVYSGDIFKTGGGLIEITIFDEKGANEQPNGSSVRLAVFGPKFLNPKTEMKLTEGTYHAATTGKNETWMPAQEMNFMGIPIPIGTFAAYDDQTRDGQFLYGSEGTIKIEKAKNNQHKITFDFESQSGYRVKGSFEGAVPLEDQSKDNEDDGSSTLTEDLEMKLKYLNDVNEPARCFPQTKVYIKSLGYVDVDKITTIATPAAPEKCGYQWIDIGLPTGTYKPDPKFNDPGKLAPGHIIRLDLLVKPGDEGKITPGTYTISPNRYLISMRPGVCFRGIQVAEGHIGTRWMDLKEVTGVGIPQYSKDNQVIEGGLNMASMDGYASLYEGTVKITKAEGGDNHFTFEINGKDVLHHNITGTWTGPVVLGTSNTPVVSSGNEFKPKEQQGGKQTAQPANKTASRFPSMNRMQEMSPVENLPVAFFPMQ